MILRKINSAVMSEMTYQLNNRNIRPFIFDHLPKCAGTSIVKTLKKGIPKRFIFNTKSEAAKSIERYNKLDEVAKAKIKLVHGHSAYNLIPHLPSNFIASTILRNPVERIVSHYYYVLKKKNHYLHEQVVNKNITLEEYCCMDLSPELNNWYVSYFSGCSTIEVNEAPEYHLNNSIQNFTKTYQIVGFQHDISSFIRLLTKATCLVLNANNPSLENVTKNKPNFINHKTKMAIIAKNKLDIRFYEYIKNNNKINK